jgi:hypothetical protein
MANYKAELHDKESVLAYYNLMDNPKYAIYRGATPLMGAICIDWIDSDNPSGGEEKLRSWLTMTENDKSNTNVYCFQSITKEIPKKFKGEQILQYEGKTALFQLNEMIFTAPRQNNNIVGSLDSSKDFAIYERIFDMMEKQNNMFAAKFSELENKLNQKQLEDIEEEEEEEEEAPQQTGKDKLFGAIGSIIQREGVQNAIEMGAMALIAKLGGTLNNQQE